MKLPCRDSVFMIFSGFLMAFYVTCVIVPVIMTLVESGMFYVILFLSFDLSTFLSVLSCVVYKKCKEIEFFHAKFLATKPKARCKDDNYLLLLCFWIEHCRELEDIHHRFLLIDAIFEAAFLEIFRELLECYEHNGESVSMKDPRDCSYHKEFDPWQPNYAKIKRLGKTIPAAETAPNGGWYRSMPVEMRGITLRQLRAVYANAKRRCVEEKWVDWKGQPITPENLNLYHINDYVIKPFTKITQKSFVESLPSTAGTQPPRWFMSHWWGEPFPHTLDCIGTFVHDFRCNYGDEDDARGGGMTEDTPLWICAFANNQWALEEDMATDPKQSSFTKAMEVACFRTISILDAAGTVLTRIWCVFELYLTIVLKKEVAGIWVVYTAYRHRHFYKDPDKSSSESNAEDRVAVGIIPGGAPREKTFQTSAREKYFPFDRIFHNLEKINIFTAEASVPSDWVHILNSVAGIANIDATPPTSHENYDKLNNAVKASFVYSDAVLNAAHNAEPDVWKSTLITLFKGIMTNTYVLGFNFFNVGHKVWESTLKILSKVGFNFFNVGHKVWESTLKILSKGIMTDTYVLGFNFFSPRLSSSEAQKLVSSLPITCNGLVICRANGEDCEGAFEGLVEWVNKKESNSLKDLSCYKCKVGDLDRGRAAGTLLAASLASNHAQSMEELWIDETDLIDSGNVSDWASALKAMPNLKRLWFEDSGLSDKEQAILRNATHAKEVTIR